MEPDVQITFQDKKPRLAYVAFLFHIDVFFQFTGRYIGLPIGIPAKHIRLLETKEIVVYHCTLQRFNGSWVMRMFWESYRILLWNSFPPSVPRGQCSKTLGPSGAKLVFFWPKNGDGTPNQQLAHAGTSTAGNIRNWSKNVIPILQK